MKKTTLFGGLTASLGSLLAVCSFMSVLAFQRSGDINSQLNIKVDTGEITKDTNYYPSAYFSKEEMLIEEKKHMIQTEEEGAVLLKNKSNALPLASDEKHVTLFGNASVNPAYHGAAGGPDNTGIDLKTALEAEGFSINQTVYDKIAAQNVVRGNSNIGEVSPSIYKTGDFEGYKDVAIVTFCRFAGEQNDLELVDSFGVRELCLHDSEKGVLEIVKSGGFSKIIVLFNTSYPMECGWLDDYNVDSALWIGFPGAVGFTGVAKMLTGEASPSGHLVDTYASNSLSSPAMSNYGDFSFSDLPNTIYHKEYLVYAEGIYVGYKYYETRYQDQVMNINNAKGNYGVYAGGLSWDYAAEMTYPFGYGLSYADFSETVNSFTWDRTNKKVIASVTVTNTSSTPYQGKAKHTVELYASVPYESGMAQKSAIQLIGFGKTELLGPGESETLTIEAEDYMFATFDEKAVNGLDTSKKGCYVFDPGDYYFTLGNDSHDALNNVLAKKGQTGLFDQDGVSVSGDASKVLRQNLAQTDNTTYAKSRFTDEIVSNKFEEADYNHFVKDAVTYLTRDDWSTFPNPYTNLKADDDTTGTIRRTMTANSSMYTTPANTVDYKTIKYSETPTAKFVEMKDIDYDDDDKWDSFIDQLSIAELAQIPGQHYQNDAITSVGYPANICGNGPDGLTSGGILYPSQSLAASTFNTKIFSERGRFLAEDAHYIGMFTVFGGGCNLHRTPYAGRNFEYYSEDSTLSYIAGRHQGAAMSQNGLIGTFKHFLGNDQEVNRHGVATFMTEQTLRENDARAFEGALSDGAALGNMGSYSRLGVQSSSNCKALMTSLLRDEWGFKGISLTDSSKDARSYIFTADAIEAGTDIFDNDADRSIEVKSLITKNRDSNIWLKSRLSAKHFFYAYSHSKVINGLSETTMVKNFRPWWMNAIVAIDSTISGLVVISGAGYIYFRFFSKEKELYE